MDNVINKWYNRREFLKKNQAEMQNEHTEKAYIPVLKIK